MSHCKSAPFDPVSIPFYWPAPLFLLNVSTLLPAPFVLSLILSISAAGLSLPLVCLVVQKTKPGWCRCCWIGHQWQQPVLQKLAPTDTIFTPLEWKLLGVFLLRAQGWGRLENGEKRNKIIIEITLQLSQLCMDVANWNVKYLGHP